MKEISKKEQIKTDVEYFILCQNEKFKRFDNLTFDFNVYGQCTELENRYCVYFENMYESISVISSFDTHEYKTPTNSFDLELKLTEKIMKTNNITSESPIWISFYV